MKFSKAVVKYRVPILILALLLMIPSVLGMAATRVNYDMLNYLPEDMDTVAGQNELLNDFHKGAFSFLILEDMPAKDAAALKKQVERVDHVDTVLWYDSVMDISVPMELLPSRLYDAFNTENATMMAVFFDTSTSSDLTMDAIREIRAIAGEKCFVSGMSALVTDLKDLCEAEEPIYVGHASAAGQLAGALCVPVQHRHDDFDEPGLQLLSRGNLLHHQGPVRRAAIGRHHGLLHLPVEQLQ